jgi:hypothetical protein
MKIYLTARFPRYPEMQQPLSARVQFAPASHNAF